MKKRYGYNTKLGSATKYTYYPEYDNFPITLENAYKYYEEFGMIHLMKNNVIKCYQEFTGLDDSVYQLDNMKLTDEI